MVNLDFILHDLGSNQTSLEHSGFNIPTITRVTASKADMDTGQLLGTAEVLRGLRTIQTT